MTVELTFEKFLHGKDEPKSLHAQAEAAAKKRKTKGGWRVDVTCVWRDVCVSHDVTCVRDERRKMCGMWMWRVCASWRDVCVWGVTRVCVACDFCVMCVCDVWLARTSRRQSCVCGEMCVCVWRVCVTCDATCLEAAATKRRVKAGVWHVGVMWVWHVTWHVCVTCGCEISTGVYAYV